MIDKNIQPGEYIAVGQHKNCECGYGQIMKITPHIIDGKQHPKNAQSVYYVCSGRLWVEEHQQGERPRGRYVWCSYNSKKLNKNDII